MNKFDELMEKHKCPIKAVKELLDIAAKELPPALPKTCDFCTEPCGNKWCPTNEEE